jgi:rhamnosyltransferase
MKINAAIFTLYKPNLDFFDAISSVLEFCDFVILVDNTPGGHKFTQLPNNVLHISDGLNKGLGSALNIGISEARSRLVDQVILFDQDSSPTTELLSNLFIALNNNNLDQVIIGPTHIDDCISEEIFNNNSVANDVYLNSEISCLPTSGLVFNLSKIPTNFIFDESLFLDLVDFDWCWRLRSRGWRVYRLNNVFMRHRLGISEKKLLFLTYHIPAPYRHYFQFRDTLRVIIRSYVPLRSRLRLFSVLLPKLFVYPFILDHGVERLKWMLFGIYSFFIGHTKSGMAESILNRK